MDKNTKEFYIICCVVLSLLTLLIALDFIHHDPPWEVQECWEWMNEPKTCEWTNTSCWEEGMPDTDTCRRFVEYEKEKARQLYEH